MLGKETSDLIVRIGKVLGKAMLNLDRSDFCGFMECVMEIDNLKSDASEDRLNKVIDIVIFSLNEIAFS